MDKVKLLEFRRNYSVPLYTTIAFIVLAIILVGLRQFERANLPKGIIASSPIAGSDAKLISKDEAEALERKETNQQSEKPSNSTPAAPPSQSSGETGGGSAPPPSPFTANVQGIFYEGPEHAGASSKECTLKHRFKSVVRSINGPGQITYRWIRSDGNLGPVETINVGSGEAFTSISTSWTITTKFEESYHGWVKLAIITPNSSESSKANFTHTCNYNNQ